MAEQEHVHDPEGEDELVVVPRIIDMSETSINVGTSEEGAIILDLITGGIVERFVMVPQVGIRLGPALFNTAVQGQLIMFQRQQEGNNEG